MTKLNKSNLFTYVKINDKEIIKDIYYAAVNNGFRSVVKHEGKVYLLGKKIKEDKHNNPANETYELGKML